MASGTILVRPDNHVGFIESLAGAKRESLLSSYVRKLTK